MSLFPIIPIRNKGNIFPGFPKRSKSQSMFPGLHRIKKMGIIGEFVFLDSWNPNNIYEIIIDCTKIDSNLTHFPIPIALDSANALELFEEMRPGDDNFTGTNGDAPGTDKWTVSNNSATGTALISSNKLRLSIPNTSADENIGAISVFTLSGDFDIQIDYDEISNNAPSSSISYPSLFQIRTDNGNVYDIRTRVYSSGTRGMIVYSLADWVTISTHYPTGKFRIKRVGSTFTAYYWTGTQWEWDGNTAGYTFSDSDSSDVKAICMTLADFDSGCVTDFDNFKVNSGTVDGVTVPITDPWRKIAIADNLGNQLYVEKEQFDVDTQKALFHASHENFTISSTQDTKLYLYYDNTHADNDEYVGEAGDSVASLLIHSDDTDGNTDFVDSSGNNHIITVDGNVHHEIDQKKFGNSAIYFDGTDDYLSIADHDDFNIGASNATLAFWIKRNRIGTREFVCGVVDSAGSTSSATFFVELQVDNTIRFQQGCDGGDWFKFDPNLSIADTNWHHIACVRTAGLLTVYLDGVAGSVTKNVTGYVFTNQSDPFSIGRCGVYDRLFFQGYIDEFEFIKGEAKWTSDFIPPTAPYFNPAGMQVWDSNYKAVYNFAQDPSGGSNCMKDSTINANHGTPAGTMLTEDLIDGDIGKAIEFDGIDDAITCTDTGLPIGSEERTLWAVFKTTDSFAFGYGTDSSTNRFYIETDVNTIRLRIHGANIFYTATNIDDGNIHIAHIVLPTGGTTLNDLLFYMDGILLTTVDSSTNPTTTIDTVLNELFIARNAPGTTFGAAQIAGCGITNEGMTAAQVKAHYNALSNNLLTITKKE